jgi:hypothetical protein
MRKLTIQLIILFLVTGFTTSRSFGQETVYKQLYKEAFSEQYRMLREEKPIDFKQAVFLTENAYHRGELNYESFKDEISLIGNQLRALINQKKLTGYRTAGNWAVFTYLMDSLPINNYTPCTYDFEDFMGTKDWTKMFVTKLMKTKKGNCHSLPYYYKILCEEIGVNAHLALAPNHIYIKHIDEKGEWTNVELTNGGFPRDQWLITQMAISIEAIRNEIYMKPLTQKESIALTMFDLATAYEFQYGIDSFYLAVIDTALTHFPTCIPLLMSKANYYTEAGKNEQAKEHPDQTILKEMYDNQRLVYQQINELGLKNMPAELYEKWVETIRDDKQKSIFKN